MSNVIKPTGANDEVIWFNLKGRGLNDFAVAGIMGNLFAESSLRPNNLQNVYEARLGFNDVSYTAAVDNGSYTNFIRDSAGYGLAQWTYWSRKEGLLKFAQTVKKSIGDLEMQLGFLWKEIQTYSKTMTVLRSATSVRQASDIVLIDYERPANTTEANKVKRAEFGQGYYNKFAGKVLQKEDAIMSQGSGDKPSAWAKDATDWAKNIKLFEGDGKGNYDWQQPMTREMFATVLHRYLKIIGKL